MKHMDKNLPNDGVAATNLVWHSHRVASQERARQKSQSPVIIWMTGLSGAGKSTLANGIEGELFRMGRHSYLLDGDNVRHGLNKNLGFSDADRVENIRRVGEVAKLFTDAGLIVITAFISPFRADRNMVRSLVAPGEFVEVYVKAPLATCEQRDPKGLYKKARSGVIKNFTGIDSPYEEPADPELVIDTSKLDVQGGVSACLSYLREKGFIA